MQQYITTIISSLLCIYLPIEDNGIRMSCSLAIAQICYILLLKLVDVMDIFSAYMSRFIGGVSIIINENNYNYNKIIEHYCDRYTEYLKECLLNTGAGKSKFTILSLKSKNIIEKFEFDGKTYEIKITFNTRNKPDDDKQQKKSTDVLDIVISSRSSMTVLNKYIEELIRKTNSTNPNGVTIFKATKKSTDDKNFNFSWNFRFVRITKNTQNTFVSESVKKNFFADVSSFITDSKHYDKVGIAYKRGYVFYGEPGTGKTSLVKAIANEYNLPVFIIDLSIFQNNNDLMSTIDKIHYNISAGSKHILLFEDVDRSDVFSDTGSGNKITEDCILNILDGVDESYGRITILTTNDITQLQIRKGLMRPGRIDKIINVTYCTSKQIIDILNFHYENCPNIDLSISKDILITPATLIQIILNNSDPLDVINLLGTHKDFRNYTI